MQNLNYWLVAEAENPAQNVISMEESATEEVVVTDSGVVDDGTGTAPKPKPNSMSSMILIIGLIAFMFIFMFRGPRKQQKEQMKMRQSLQKNDRVQTIGGILGTIIDIRENEVTIKIDESNNTKMKIAINAISKKVD